MRRWLPALLALSGCASYNWSFDGQVAEYYRWKVISRAEFPHVCGFVAPDGFNAGGACAIRVRQGVIQATDRRIDTGEPSGVDRVGRVCLIHATMTEDEAARMLDKYGELRLDLHERRHCAGWIHE